MNSINETIVTGGLVLNFLKNTISLVQPANVHHPYIIFLYMSYIKATTQHGGRIKAYNVGDGEFSPEYKRSI